MSDNKKKWIKRIILWVVDLVLTVVISISRYNSRLASDPISVFHAMSDGLFVIGFMNLGLGLLIWISTTGFFDIFGYSAKSILNFFIPRSFMERMGMTRDSGSFYEYKVKKEENRKNSRVPREMLWIGIFMILVSIVFYLLV